MFTIATLKLSMCMLLENAVSHSHAMRPPLVQLQSLKLRPLLSGQPLFISMVKLIAFVRCGGILNIMLMGLPLFISYVQ